MSGHGHLPPVSPDERLARFITVEKWIRADHTVRQDAFIPPKDLNLSVTRHLHMSQEQLWQIGQAVADAISEKRHAKLFGRADLTAVACTGINLRVEPFPIPGNPQHTHVTGWPLDKPAQKSIAQQLAAAASFVSKAAEPAQ
jgi:hypothetical protein